MSLFLDDLLANHARGASLMKGMTPVAFEVTDIWRALPEVDWQSAVTPLLNTTPALPPYPITWLEWRSNTPILDKIMLQELGKVQRTRSGVALSAYTIRGAKTIVSNHNLMTKYSGAPTQFTDSALPFINEAERLGAQKLVLGTAFAQMEEHIITQCVYFVALDARGMMIPIPVHDGYYLFGREMSDHYGLQPDGTIRKVTANEETGESIVQAAWQAMYMCALLHVKNVVTQDHAQPKGIQAARVRKGRAPFQEWKTLHIVAPKVARRYERGEDISAEIKEAARTTRAHMVMGHFATYPDEPGRRLFGRHSGTWWIPAHTRGNKEAGAIGKDYRVSPAGGS